MLIVRYLTKEVILTLGVVMMVLLLVFLSNQFAHYLGATALGLVAGDVLFRVILCEIPHLLGLLLPLGFYLAILLAYGRLYSDSEMLVLHACGFSRGQLCRLTFVLGAGLCLMVAWLNFYVTPNVLQQRDKLLQNAGLSSLLSTILPGRFQQANDGSAVFFVRSLARDRRSMEGVFVAQQQATPAADGTPRWAVLAAKRGYQSVDAATGDNFIVTTQGYRYVGTPGKHDYQVFDFKRYGVRIGHADTAAYTADTDVLSTPKLWEVVKRGDMRAIAEWQWRWCMPLSVIWLTLLAVCLSRVNPRQGRYSRLLPAILCYTCYVNLMFVSRAWLQKALIPPLLGLWWVQVVALLLSITLWYVQERGYRWRRLWVSVT